MTSETIWYRNFRILWLNQFISIAGLTVLVPLLPIYIASLKDLSVTEIQLWSGIAIAAPAVTTMISSPLWGKLGEDRKSTRLNSSHVSSSYAVSCLKSKIFI